MTKKPEAGITIAVIIKEIIKKITEKNGIPWPKPLLSVKSKISIKAPSRIKRYAVENCPGIKNSHKSGFNFFAFIKAVSVFRYGKLFYTKPFFRRNFNKFLRAEIFFQNVGTFCCNNFRFFVRRNFFFRNSQKILHVFIVE